MGNFSQGELQLGMEQGLGIVGVGVRKKGFGLELGFELWRVEAGKSQG